MLSPPNEFRQAVLALEQDAATGEQVTLLRRAVERQDRELIDGILSVRATTIVPPYHFEVDGFGWLTPQSTVSIQ